MPPSWHWTCHSGGYRQQAELYMYALKWCKLNNDDDDATIIVYVCFKVNVA